MNKLLNVKLAAYALQQRTKQASYGGWSPQTPGYDYPMYMQDPPSRTPLHLAVGGVAGAHIGSGLGAMSAINAHNKNTFDRNTLGKALDTIQQYDDFAKGTFGDSLNHAAFASRLGQKRYAGDDVVEEFAKTIDDMVNNADVNKQKYLGIRKDVRDLHRAYRQSSKTLGGRMARRIPLFGAAGAVGGLGLGALYSSLQKQKNNNNSLYYY